MQRFHLIVTSVRLAFLAGGILLMTMLSVASVFALNPLTLIFNVMLLDLVCGRFMTTEAQLAEMDVKIDFPGRQLASIIAVLYGDVRQKTRRGLAAKTA